MRSGGSCGGFTIVELLVVMGLIVLLLSILTVAIASASRTSQSAHTLALMSSITQALARFEADIGYLPPVLGADMPAAAEDLRRLFDPRGADLEWGNSDDVLPERPEWLGGGENPAYATNVQEWHSVTSLAEFLLGYAQGREDGYGEGPQSPDYAGERPPLGIRTPGPDGLWGGAVDRNNDRQVDLLDRNPPLTGQVYGPYLELKDERLLASGTTDANGNIKVFLPGESGFDPADPKVIVDYWGQPIRYYRRLYPIGDLRSAYRPTVADIPTPTLADIFLLRPFEIEPGQDIKGILDLNPKVTVPGMPPGDPFTTRALKAAPFALFSPGPDRSFEPEMRSDREELNRDNIVELGR